MYKVGDTVDFKVYFADRSWEYSGEINCIAKALNGEPLYGVWYEDGNGTLMSCLVKDEDITGLKSTDWNMYGD